MNDYPDKWFRYTRNFEINAKLIISIRLIYLNSPFTQCRSMSTQPALVVKSGSILIMGILVGGAFISNVWVKEV